MGTLGRGCAERPCYDTVWVAVSLTPPAPAGPPYHKGDVPTWGLPPAGDQSKPFFSGLDTLPQGGGGACLPFLKFWVPSAESPPPPPVGVGQEWVGISGGNYL